VENALSKGQAKAQLNQCIDDGVVHYTRHFREELAKDNLTTEDILSICKSGAIIMAPEKDIKTGDWKYRIEGITVDGDRVALVFVLKPELKAVFITVFKRTT
jgi:hypothetical protein